MVTVNKIKKLAYTFKYINLFIYSSCDAALDFRCARMQMMQEKSATSQGALVEPLADLGRK